MLQQVLGARRKILLDAVADEDTTDRHLKTPGGRPMLE